jgi:hypothetical protein
LCSGLFTPIDCGRPVYLKGLVEGIEMTLNMWKEVLASLNPSPIFLVVANFAELLAMNGDGLYPNEVQSAGGKKGVTRATN